LWGAVLISEGEALMRIFVVAVLSIMLTGPAVAQRQAPPGSNYQEGMQAAYDVLPAVAITCRVGNVGVFADRVHVRCAGDQTAAVQSVLSQIMQQQGVGGGGGSGAGGANSTEVAGPPTFFAVGVQANPALADLVVSLASQASAQNRQVQIFFRPSATHNPPGCGHHDCRLMTGLVMQVAP
jgi:hypothetical protein